jgi:predicted nucleic acid-binding protein
VSDSGRENTTVVAACIALNQKAPPLIILEGKIYGTIGLLLKTTMQQFTQQAKMDGLIQPFFKIPSLDTEHILFMMVTPHK